jgi:hypothetical protein
MPLEPVGRVGLPAPGALIHHPSTRCSRLLQREHMGILDVGAWVIGDVRLGDVGDVDGVFPLGVRLV